MTTVPGDVTPGTESGARGPPRDYLAGVGGPESSNYIRPAVIYVVGAGRSAGPLLVSEELIRRQGGRPPGRPP